MSRSKQVVETRIREVPCISRLSPRSPACSTTSMQPLPANPLLVASCPPLQPLTDDSFGATTAKLVEVAGQYNKCRAAAGVQP